MRRTSETVQCCYCGAAMDAGAAACPSCGSDELTGWSEETSLDGIDLGMDEFDDDEYQQAIDQEFGRGGHRYPPVWQVICAAIILLFLVLLVIRGVL